MDVLEPKGGRYAGRSSIRITERRNKTQIMRAEGKNTLKIIDSIPRVEDQGEGDYFTILSC